MLNALRKAIIKVVAGTDIAVLLNLEPIYVSSDLLKKFPASPVVDLDILKTRSRKPNGKRFSERNGDEVVEEAG